MWSLLHSFVCYGLFQQDSLQTEQLLRHDLPRHDVSKVFLFFLNQIGNSLNILFLHCDNFLTLFSLFLQVICSLCETEQDVSINFFNIQIFVFVNMFLDADLWFVFSRSSRTASVVAYVWGSTFAQNASSLTMM